MASSSKALFQGLTLLTDLYQLTMAQAFWKKDLAEREAVFHLFFRRPPFGGAYALSSGLESVVHFLQNFHFSSSDLDYLAGLSNPDESPRFDKGFLLYLKGLKFSCSVDGVEEGTPIFPQEPMLRVCGPILQCLLLESPLLNLMNFPTLVATKASRVCHAAQGDPVLEFGLRRAQGVDGALTASRAAYIGGCAASSNVLAGKIFGIPVAGTMAHSWVMAFSSEEEAFRAFVEAESFNTNLLVDTFNSVQGTRLAAEVGKSLEQKGRRLQGIRLDSGDLCQLSQEARKILDQEGLHYASIVASNDLTEEAIKSLKERGSKITHWGVGTHLVTCSGQAALDGVYKLSALRNEAGEWDYKLKLSEQMSKTSNPGILRVARFERNGMFCGDMLFDEEMGMGDPLTNVDLQDETRSHHFGGDSSWEALLRPIFKDGILTYELPDLTTIRKRSRGHLQKLPSKILNLKPDSFYPTGMEKGLYLRKTQLIHKLERRASEE